MSSLNRREGRGRYTTFLEHSREAPQASVDGYPNGPWRLAHDGRDLAHVEADDDAKGHHLGHV
jgi:hypothetical protein